MTISDAVNVLNEGGIIVFPTDTAYGIGCRIDRPMSLRKLINIRKRPAGKPFPVLVSSISMAINLWKPLDNSVKNLLKTYWPGALTVVYMGNSRYSHEGYIGSDGSIGLRMPNHDIALELIRGVGVPIIGASANFSNEKTPFSLAEVDPELLKSVDGVVAGVCHEKNSSTVINCSSKPWKILRQGVIKIKE